MKSINFPDFIQQKNPGKTSFDFITTQNISEIGMPISAVLGFVFVGDSLVVIKNKNLQWDIVGGKIENNENWVEALERETYEEAGVFINVQTIEMVGYFKCENSDDVISDVYPKLSAMPVCICYASGVDFKWTKRETFERAMLSIDKVRERFQETRADNGQLLAVLNYVESLQKRKNIKVNFDYIEVENDPNIIKLPAITTQCMCLIRYKGKYCVVRDFDEDFFSLPGGGCNLGESSVSCLRREVLEETQIVLSNFNLIGRVVVSFSVADKILSQVTHDRYISKIDFVEDFVARKDGFEVEERDFVEIDELCEKVMLLQNDTGEKIIKQLELYENTNYSA
jgi:8-oxo-dGTP pyrophosphatase MutT (NUDIX family)